MILNARWRKRVNTGRRVLRSRIRGGGLILFYHRIADRDIDPFGQCLTREQFEQQLSWLRTWGNILSLDEMLERTRAGQLPPRSVTLTFDDGYLDNLTTVRPILERHNIQATFYIASGNFGAPFWWDVLATAILRPEYLPEPTVDWFQEIPNLAVKDRNRLVLQLHHYLQPLRPEQQREHLEQLVAWAGVSYGEMEDRAMTAAEITELSTSESVEIGAHTRGHVSLGMHPKAYQRQVLAENLETLASLVSTPIRHLSYPYGLPDEHYSADTVALAEELGFASAASTIPDVMSSRSSIFELPRLWAENWSLPRFQREIMLWLGR